jgi:hypothetical protein
MGGGERGEDRGGRRVCAGPALVCDAGEYLAAPGTPAGLPLICRLRLARARITPPVRQVPLNCASGTAQVSQRQQDKAAGARK